MGEETGKTESENTHYRKLDSPSASLQEEKLANILECLWMLHSKSPSSQFHDPEENKWNLFHIS